MSKLKCREALFLSMSSASYRNSVLPFLAAMLIWSAGCGTEKPAEAAAPDVEVVEVAQKDVPITRQWVATLTGKVNAQIRAQVAGYLMSQRYQTGRM